MNEVWKQIPGYSNYEASNTGKIRSKDKKIVNFKKPTGSYGEYRTACLRSDFGKIHSELVHRLVYSAFNGPIPIVKGKRIVIDHINNNKSDNRLSNLQMLTQSENMLKALKDNLREDNLPIIATDHETGENITFFSMMELSRYFNIPRRKVYILIYHHKHKLFRNRYTFSIDEKNIARVNRNRILIKIYDHIDKKWLFPLSKGHASMITGVDSSAIYSILNKPKCPSTIYGYTFKWATENDDVPIVLPEVAKIERKKLLQKDIDDRSLERVLIELKDYITGILYVFRNYLDVANKANVTLETVGQMVKDPALMVNGYCAKKCTDKREFVDYDKKYIYDNAENRVSTITITYQDDKIETYKNLYELGKKLNIPIRRNMKLKNLGIILRYRGIKYKTISVNKMVA